MSKHYSPAPRGRSTRAYQEDMSMNIERTPADYHALFTRLDAEYSTDPRSPLHHDNRCTYCNGNAS